MAHYSAALPYPPTSAPVLATAPMLNEELCWQAVQTRDPARDGEFVYGVLTTGVYCRPSCGSRRPLRRNFRVFPTPADAERAGLRACKRCSPAGSQDASGLRATHALQLAIRTLQADPAAAPSIPALAASVGVSPSHLHRLFRRSVGLTPRKYLDSLRLATLKRELKTGAEVTASIYASGFGSGSRVYERSNTQLGMTPAQYRDGGRGVRITYVSVPSPLGRMMLAATARGLCFLHFGDTSAGLLALLRQEYPHATLAPAPIPAHPDLARWLAALDAYLEGSPIALDLPLDVRATAFQLRVWSYLCTIPYGQVQSYSQIAANLGTPQSTRAVARAIAANPVALLVPCHRVIRNNGELGGYRWGLDRKRSLLDRERAAPLQVAEPR